jgi:transcription initiation factor TFIID subunit 2
LFPDHIIDPLWDVTKTLTYALTTQWSGIQIVPKDWADLWLIIGLSYWMTGWFMQELFGNNEFRFRLKKDADRICELDIDRPSLYAQGFQVPIDPASLDFIKLKAPVVLTILEKRLHKVASSMVLHRVVRKTFLSAEAGDLKNGLMSTAHFIRLCEKIGHNKLDQFFQQWVYGSGYPQFEVSQRFNKKRMIVEMGIRQVQAVQTKPRRVTPEEFLKDAFDKQKNVVVGPTQPLFTGPMTIRIHEADGTPYEHVVEIKEGYTKLEIPYNTKYKRLKRSRRQKERAAAGAGVDISFDVQQNDDVLLYCLGDVLQGEEEVDDWRLVDWSKEDEERMAQESFEWIRMDADFEWVCTLNINQPDYMFLSQLQQDRDVVAQYDSIRHFAKIRESALVSTILVRTLMDRRYYYGIRVEAAMALARCATAELDWVGQFHLQKAFQEFFCYPGSQIPRGNDFSEFTAYYVQNAIPRAMSRIRNFSGVCPGAVQKWILDILRYNDNSNNFYDDCYYVANLMRALADTLSPQVRANDFGFDLMDEDIEDEDDEYSERKLHDMALAELDRFQRMDQWQPTYRNIVSEVALGIRKDLMVRGIKEIDHKVFMAYTREGTLDTLRVKAFDCLIDLGALRNQALAPYICYVMANDPSPFVRRRVQAAFGRGLGLVVCEQNKPAALNGPDLGEMIIEDPGMDNASAARKEELAKETITGAMAALKKELGEDPLLKEAIWKAVTYVSPP